MSKISIIITAHNYGKYIAQCIDSALKQNYPEFEVIVVNDGSTDNTAEILASYRDTIQVITLAGVGLAGACNAGIRSSSGEYIIRLDADDYFDENILMVEANILKGNPGVHMVYPDYYRINQHGEIVEHVRLPKVNDEVKLLDRSPLAAGALFRRRCYDEIGGYNEELRYQEDYDFWIRFIDKFSVYNVNLPLMYYRRHDVNMSGNFEERMKARQYVKKKFVDQKGYREGKRTLAFIPAMGLFRNEEKLALKKLSGKPLIAYTIEEALACDLVDRVIVSTEDEEIADCAVSCGAEVPFLRPRELSRTSVSVEDVLRYTTERLKETGGVPFDFVAVLYYHVPFKKERHITEAIDTILLYDTDSVISVVTDITFHWKPGEYGLKPVGYQKRLLREDKETIYKEASALYVVKSANLASGGFLGNTIGHIEMSQNTAWRIEDNFSFWVAEKMLQDRGVEQVKI
ncbi:glycosyltransferase [Candidatus Omnitrophota bacterium]